MGSYDRTDVCEFENHNGHQNDKVREEMIDLFKQHHLNLQIKCNLNILDYLDITFDLTTGLFKPYNKTKNISRYVTAKSNHVPSILKEIPKSVSNVFRRILVMNRFSMLLHRFFFNDILDKCRCSEKLTFEKEQYTH